jgi:hypothetical protein
MHVRCLETTGGCRQQLCVPERGAAQRRGVHPGAPGCRRRPNAATHQVRAMRRLLSCTAYRTSGAGNRGRISCRHHCRNHRD